MHFRVYCIPIGLALLVLFSMVSLFPTIVRSDHVGEQQSVPNLSQTTLGTQVSSLSNNNNTSAFVSPWVTLKNYVSHHLSLKFTSSLVTTATNYTVGSTVLPFWVNNLSANLNDPETAFYRINATLEASSNYSYVFLDNNYLSTTYPSLASALATKFDTIYHKEVPFFGTPSNVDHTGKIIILLYPITGFAGVVGYFNPLDEYQPSSDPTNITHYSNYADLIYINIPIDNLTAADTAAHEFKHLLEFHMNPNQDVWLDEGLAVYAEQYTGYNQTLGQYISAYTANIDLSMTYWQYDTNGLAHYGAAFLFLLYLSDRFSPDLISNISTDGHYSGLAAINYALKNYNSSLSVAGVFQDFIIALAINRANLPQYHFLNYTGQASVFTNWNLNSQPDLVQQSIQHWSGEIIKLPSSTTTEDFWLLMRNESAPWMGYQRDLHMKLVQYNTNTGSWEITSLSTALPTLYKESSTYTTNYLIIISTTGNSSGYNPASNPITWLTNYHLFSQPAFTTLPLIQYTNMSSHLLQVNVYMPFSLTTNTSWVDPSQASVILTLLNASNLVVIASYNNLSWNLTTKSYSLLINMGKIPLGDYFFQATITSGSQKVYLFSIGLFTGINTQAAKTNLIGFSVIFFLISFFFLAIGRFFYLRNKKRKR